MDGRVGVRVDTMFRGSRAPRGRFEDRCDGAGSEADGAKPPVKPGPVLPVLGVLVLEASLFWCRFCPAYLGEVFRRRSFLPKWKFFIQSLLRRTVVRECGWAGFTRAALGRG